MKYKTKIKKRSAALLLAICCTAFTGGCSAKNDPNTVTVLNYGKYLGPC